MLPTLTLPTGNEGSKQGARSRGRRRETIRAKSKGGHVRYLNIMRIGLNIKKKPLYQPLR